MYIHYLGCILPSSSICTSIVSYTGNRTVVCIYTVGEEIKHLAEAAEDVRSRGGRLQKAAA